MLALNEESLRTSDLWIHYMRKGEFTKAWEFSDQVLKAGLNRDYLNLPRHFQCIWDGTPLRDKRVLIRCYHGLGDTIQFIRYVPLVKKIASRVIVWAQPRLIDLLQTVNGIDELIPLHEGEPETEYDVDVEIMELPHIFRTTLTTIPLIMPYLSAEPIRISDKDHLAIGLVWQAGDWEKARSVPFNLFLPLAKIKKIQFIILQDNAALAGWQNNFGIHPGECTLYDHAGIIRGLDLLLTIDSMPAHLAGALNVPVWVMLHQRSDWRWMENRNDSPWYPSMRLFRQKKPGNWNSVVDQIMKELKKKSACF